MLQSVGLRCHPYRSRLQPGPGLRNLRSPFRTAFHLRSPFRTAFPVPTEVPMTLAVTTKISLISLALIVAACGEVDSNSGPAQNPSSNARTQGLPSVSGAQSAADTKAIQNVE